MADGRYRMHSGHCSALALNTSVANDPERTFGERGYIRQTALRAMCNWLTAGWLIVDATQCGTKQRGYRGKMDYKGDPLDSCLLYTSPSPRDRTRSRMPSS